MALSTQSNKTIDLDPKDDDTPQVKIAKLAVRKVQLDQELHKVRHELKRAANAADIELPVAVELEDFAVLVKKPQYPGLPQIVIAPLFR